MLFFPHFVQLLNNYSRRCLHFIMDLCFDIAFAVHRGIVLPTVEQITDQFSAVQWWFTLDMIAWPPLVFSDNGSS